MRHEPYHDTHHGYASKSVDFSRTGTHPNPSIFREYGNALYALRIKTRRFFETSINKIKGLRIVAKEKIDRRSTGLPRRGKREGKQGERHHPTGDVGVRHVIASPFEEAGRLLSSTCRSGCLEACLAAERPSWLRDNPLRSSSVSRPPTLDQNRTGRQPAS